MAKWAELFSLYLHASCEKFHFNTQNARLAPTTCFSTTAYRLQANCIKCSSFWRPFFNGILVRVGTTESPLDAAVIEVN